MRYLVAALVFAMTSREAGAQDKPAAISSEAFEKRVQELRKEAILSHLKSARTIVIADFEAPGGIKVRQVLRRDSKVGEYWNSPELPAKRILIYHAAVVGDLGWRTPLWSSTGYYELDGNGRIPLSEGKSPSLSMEEVMEYLKNHPVDRDAAPDPAKPGD